MMGSVADAWEKLAAVFEARVIEQFERRLKIDRHIEPKKIVELTIAQEKERLIGKLRRLQVSDEPAGVDEVRELILRAQSPEKELLIRMLRRHREFEETAEGDEVRELIFEETAEGDEARELILRAQSQDLRAQIEKLLPDIERKLKQRIDAFLARG